MRRPNERRAEAAPEPSDGHRPAWDACLHTLFWKGTPLKHFKLEAACQEAILAAFEQRGWPEIIEFSFEPDDGGNLKSRLRATIHNLNRSVRPYLHFWQEGSGTRIGWRSWRTPGKRGGRGR